jgi:uncharacterized membrane protein YkvA (DUF1232 family)
MENATIDRSSVDDILQPESAEMNDSREREVRAGFWRTLANAAGRIPFAEDLVAAYFAALDPRTPTRVRGTLIAALAYFVMPLDLVPDFIVGLGFTDDAAVLTAAITAVQRHIRPRHRRQARETLSQRHVR